MFLQIDNLSKQFTTQHQEITVLKNINIEIEQGEFVCVVGASGSGKSTLLRQIAGLDTPSSGEIRIGGVPVRGPSPDRAATVKRHAIFQDYRDELMMILRQHGAESLRSAST